MTANSDNSGLGAYAVGYGAGAIRWLEMRYASHHAAFCLPYLSTGMRLLDVGCGPDSITLGLAQTVAPGLITGLDLELSMVELASRKVREGNIANTSFGAGSIYELPFQ